MSDEIIDEFEAMLESPTQVPESDAEQDREIDELMSVQIPTRPLPRSAAKVPAKAKPTAKAPAKSAAKPAAKPAAKAPTKPTKPGAKVPILDVVPRKVVHLADDRKLTNKGKESLRARWSVENSGKSRDGMMAGLLTAARGKFGADRVFGSREELGQLALQQLVSRHGEPASMGRSLNFRQWCSC